MIARVLIALLGSFAAFLVFVYHFEKKYLHQQMPLPVGFLLAFINIILSVSAAFSGALLLRLGWVPHDENTARMIRGIGAVFGIWSVRILLQAAQNFVRSRIGVPKIPIVWIKPIHKTQRRGTKKTAV